MRTWLRDHNVSRELLAQKARELAGPIIRALVFYQLFTWTDLSRSTYVHGESPPPIPDIVLEAGWVISGMVIFYLLESLLLKVRRKGKEKTKSRWWLTVYAWFLPLLATLALAAANPGIGSGEQILLVPIVLILVVIGGAIFLDIGLALGLLLITHSWLLIAYVEQYTLSPPFFTSSIQSYALAMALFSTLATVPLVIYVHGLARLYRQKRRLDQGNERPPLARIAIAALLIFLTFPLSYISAWAVDRNTTRQFAVDKQYLDFAPMSALGTEIEREFRPSDMHSDNRELADFLVRKSVIRGHDLYIFERIDTDKTIGPQFELVMATQGQSRTSEMTSRGPSRMNAGDVSILRDFQKISSGERQALLNCMRRTTTPGQLALSSESVLLAAGGSPTMTRLFRPLNQETRPGTFDKRLPLVQPPNPIQTSPTGFPVYKRVSNADVYSDISLMYTAHSPYILLASPKSIGGNWWQPDKMGSLRSMSVTFPWFFYGSLFFASLFLFGVAKRDRLRHQLIQSEERARISQESHDRVSNRLSAIALQIELEAKKQAESQKFLAHLPDSIRRAVSDLKDVVSVSGEGPENERGSLKARLIEICELRDKDYSFDLKHQIDIDENLSLGGRKREALISCLEEALGNVAKHAHAQEVTVTIDRPQLDMCRLVVEDDGSGFEVPTDYDRLLDDGHMGLAGLAKRAKELGGELRIDSALDYGTAVEITFGV